MIREVDLAAYLPPFIAGYKEIGAVLDAENPEFVLVWEAADRVLKNEFIETANEYGLSRFEKILKVYPAKEDTIESRRTRIQARWSSTIPYTERMLVEKLTTLCGGNNFTLTKKYDCYKIEIEVSLEMYGQIEELERIIGGMVPCNMVVEIQNKLSVEAYGEALTGGGICSIETFFITNDANEQFVINGKHIEGSGTVITEFYEIQSEY